MESAPSMVATTTPERQATPGCTTATMPGGHTRSMQSPSTSRPQLAGSASKRNCGTSTSGNSSSSSGRHGLPACVLPTSGTLATGHANHGDAAGREAPVLFVGQASFIRQKVIFAYTEMLADLLHGFISWLCATSPPGSNSRQVNSGHSGQTILINIKLHKQRVYIFGYAPWQFFRFR